MDDADEYELAILDRIGTFDFLDVGANTGNSFAFAMDHLGAKNGLAIDINPRAVRKLRDAGVPVLLRDCRDLKLPGAEFKFGMLSHILEHMDNIGQSALVLNGVASAVQDFVFIRQPFFDEDDYLSTLGLKSVGSNLSYHPLHIRSEHFIDMFRTLNLRDYAIYGSDRLAHSHATAKIVSCTAPLDTKGWKARPEDKPKLIQFDRPVYRELIAVVRLSDRDEAEQAALQVPGRSVLMKSAHRFAPLCD